MHRKPAEAAFARGDFTGMDLARKRAKEVAALRALNEKEDEKDDDDDDEGRAFRSFLFRLANSRPGRVQRRVNRGGF